MASWQQHSPGGQLVLLEKNASIEAMPPSLQRYAEILRPKGIFDNIQSAVWSLPQELSIPSVAIPAQAGLPLPVCSTSHISSTSCGVPVYSRDHLKIQMPCTHWDTSKFLQRSRLRPRGPLGFCSRMNWHSNAHLLLLKHHHSTLCIFSCHFGVLSEGALKSCYNRVQ